MSAESWKQICDAALKCVSSEWFPLQSVIAKYTDVCDDESFHPLALSKIVDKSLWMTKVTTQGCHNVGAPNNWGANHQALKKFYGALHGPASCTHYFVSDSESLPFRPFDFKHSFQLISGNNLIATWYSKPGCSLRQDDWLDPHCDAVVAQELGLDRAWSADDHTQKFGWSRKTGSFSSTALCNSRRT